MIKVKVCRNAAGAINGFEVRGHAGCAVSGQDIVCSAASVTAYTAAGAIEELVGLKGFYKESDGYFICRLPENLEEESEAGFKARIILETALIGFRQIELAYGKFIKVLDKGGANHDQNKSTVVCPQKRGWKLKERA